MALRYYYFRAESFELSSVQARVPSAIAVPAPGVTDASLLVVSCDDASQDDLVEVMSWYGFELDGSSAIAPGFQQTRHHGAQSTEPTVPAPLTGDRYYDLVRGYERYYDGTIWRPVAPVQTVEVPFTFATASPLAITTIRPGDRVMRAEIAVETVFDGAGAYVELGTAADPDAILVPNDTDLTIADTYRTFDRFESASTVGIELAIVPAGSTQGAGRVFLEVWRS